jgi:hypothetical protein
MLASLLASLVSGRTAAAVQRARRAAVAYALAGLAAICGAIFLFVGLFIWASERYGDLEAALGIGACFVVIAVVILIIHRITAGFRARREARRRRADMTAAGVATAIALLPSLLRGKGGLGLLLGPAAAVLAYAIYRENVGSDDDEDPDDQI